MLKKLFYRLIILSLIGVLVSPFVLTKENGTKIMSKEEFFSFDSELIKSRYIIAISKVKRMLKNQQTNINDAPGTLDPEYTKLYKWKDEKGEWHFSDAPAENYSNEEINININRNVLNFGDLPSESATQDEEKSASRGSGSNRSSEPGKKGYFDRMTSAVEDANNVQSQVDNDIKRKEDAVNSY